MENETVQRKNENEIKTLAITFSILIDVHPDCNVLRQNFYLDCKIKLNRFISHFVPI